MTAVFDGAAHIFVPTNLLALLALGLVAGQSRHRILLRPLLLFATGLLAGAIAIASGLRDPPAAFALLVLAAMIGLLVAMAHPLPSTAILALALLVGAALMLNAPPQAVTISAAAATQLGVGSAALIALSLIAYVTTKGRHGWQRIGIRILGSWIAASATLVLALRLFR